MSESCPGVTVVNRQRSQRVDVQSLRTLSAEALPLCLEQPGVGSAPLPGLELVAVTLVSDRKIAELHVRFMEVPGPTDVITFEHGEIVISVDTAARQACDHGQQFLQELFRYVVHGLLHLNGHEDASSTEADLMWKAQEKIVAALWKETPSGDSSSATHSEARR